MLSMIKLLKWSSAWVSWRTFSCWARD